MKKLKISNRMKKKPKKPAELKKVMWDFEAPLFRQTIYFAVGGTVQELQEDVKRIHGDYEIFDVDYRGKTIPFSKDTAGKVFKVEGSRKKLAFWIWVWSKPRRGYTIADTVLLSHEAVHLAVEILRHVGVKLSTDSEEVYAYLQEEILYECLRRFKSL